MGHRSSHHQAAWPVCSRLLPSCQRFLQLSIFCSSDCPIVKRWRPVWEGVLFWCAPDFVTFLLFSILATTTGCACCFVLPAFVCCSRDRSPAARRHHRRFHKLAPARFYAQRCGVPCAQDSASRWHTCNVFTHRWLPAPSAVLARTNRLGGVFARNHQSLPLAALVCGLCFLSAKENG